MKDRILETAITLLREKGIKKLSQPEICRALGIRQSQLTYYFPRREDLIKAIVNAFTTSALSRLRQLPQQTEPAILLAELAQLITAPGPVRGFLGLLIEADQEPAIAPIMREHMLSFAEALQQQLGNLWGPEQIQFLLLYLRGVAVSHFLNPNADISASLKPLLTALGSLAHEH